MKATVLNRLHLTFCHVAIPRNSDAVPIVSLSSATRNSSDHLTHARNFLQSILVYEVLDRLGQKRNAFCGAKIGFGSVGIAAIEHRASAEFCEQGRNFRQV